MLVNVPLVDQLEAATNDGLPSDNAQADCVPASCAGAAQGLGLALDKTPDWWKDQIYGEAYTGATAPARFAPVFASLGLQLGTTNGTSGDVLVTAIRAHLALGQPVLGAIPSLWGNDYAGQYMAAFAGPTHEVCFCDDAAGQLTAMNPWHGFYQTEPYSWWAQRLVYGHINPITEVAMAWTKQPDGTGRDAHGHTCGAGSLAYLGEHNLANLDGTTDETFYNADHAFLGLANGPALRILHNGDGSWTIDQAAGFVVADLWGMIQTLKQAPAPTPPPASAATPQQVAADTAMRSIIGALHLYAQAGVSND